MSEEFLDLESLASALEEEVREWYGRGEVKIKTVVKENSIRVKIRTLLIFDNTDLEFFTSVAQKYGLKLDFEVYGEGDYTIICLFFYPGR